MRILLLDREPSYVRKLLGTADVTLVIGVEEAKRQSQGAELILISSAVITREAEVRAFVAAVTPRPVVAFSPEGEIDTARYLRSGCVYAFTAARLTGTALTDLLSQAWEPFRATADDPSVIRHREQLAGSAALLRDYAAADQDARTPSRSEPYVSPGHGAGAYQIPGAAYAEQPYVPQGMPRAMRRPQPARPAAAPSRLAIPPRPLAAGHMRVLVVEDDPDGMELAQHALVGLPCVEVVPTVYDAKRLRLAEYGAVVLSLRPSFGPGFRELMDLAEGYAGTIAVVYDAANPAFCEAASQVAVMVVSREQYEHVRECVAPPEPEPVRPMPLNAADLIVEVNNDGADG